MTTVISQDKLGGGGDDGDDDGDDDDGDDDDVYEDNYLEYEYYHVIKHLDESINQCQK